MRRDPGATEERLMYRHPPAKSAIFWDVWNLSIPAVARADALPLVRVQVPRHRRERLDNVVETVTTLAGRPMPRTEYGDRLELGVDHTVSGNPARFDRGAVPLEFDDEWIRALGTGAKAVVPTLCSAAAARVRIPATSRPAPARRRRPMPSRRWAL